MNTSEKIKKLKELIDELPELEQKAVMWAIKNIDVVEIICNSSDPFAEKEFEERLQKARETQDYVYLALLMYQKTVQEQG